ncbi:DUF6476 family protein [Pelagibacterium montanilacus]|uniref:DUF6476 family protein n=1 Tax=Pelagibacterium montanilacus TaxID=2185280 RepID=UPI000F8D3AF8|nr:DUF6476 family protein [Pelagibacterium montanilacus]
MSHSHPEPDGDQPYSPEALKIMAKARRRAGFSVLIMLIGFMAIAGVVVYRLSTMESGAETRYALETVSIPEGAEVVSVQTQDGLVTVTYAVDGTTGFRIFEGSDGTMIGDVAVVAE